MNIDMDMDHHLHHLSESEDHDDAKAGFWRARQQLRTLKAELHRVKHHKRRFVDSTVLTGEEHRYATTVLQHRLKEQVAPLEAYVNEQIANIRAEADAHEDFGLKAERVQRDEVAGLMEELQELKVVQYCTVLYSTVLYVWV